MKTMLPFHQSWHAGARPAAGRVRRQLPRVRAGSALFNHVTAFLGLCLPCGNFF